MNTDSSESQYHQPQGSGSYSSPRHPGLGPSAADTGPETPLLSDAEYHTILSRYPSPCKQDEGLFVVSRAMLMSCLSSLANTWQYGTNTLLSDS